MPGVTVIGVVGGQTLAMDVTDQNGIYVLDLPLGSTYTLIASKASLPPGSLAINTVDVVAVNAYYLGLSDSLPCAPAADVNGDARVNTVDVVAIQHFIVGLPDAIGFCGQYRFVEDEERPQDFIGALIGDVL